MLRHDGNNQLKPNKNILQNMDKTNGTLLKIRSVIRENIFSTCRPRFPAMELRKLEV